MAIGQDNLDSGRGYEYTWYDYAERSSDKKYPSWVDSAPNLYTYLNAINKSQPIVQCQYEMVWSRWPRTLFFAKNINIPGVSASTVELNHAGYTIQIPTHTTYESTEITFNVIADKEGFHYYDIRNMVLQTGHPLVAGDPKATVGNPYGISPDEDTIEVRLRNSPEWDETHHHWIIHNFHPTKVGDIELTVDGSSFVEFEVTGTFTHITYDCGKVEQENESPSPYEDEQPQEQEEEEQEDVADEEEYEEEEEEYEEEDEEEDDWDDQDEWDEEDWEEQEEIEEAEEPSNDSEDEEGEPTLDDEDERAAYEALQDGEGKSDEELQAELEEKFRQENPDEDPELIETRAEFALDAAKKYKAKQQDDAAEQQFKSVSRASENRPRIVLCKNKCGWIGTKFGEANETLTRAVRFNHKISDIKYKLFLDNVAEELEAYSCKTSKLTLPHKFGMYKTPTKNIPKTSEVELEDPPFNVSEALSIMERNPNHKVRGIFD